DHVLRVLAVAHHHDAADVVAAAVEVGDAAPDLRAPGDAGDIAHSNRDATRAARDRDLLEGGDVAGVAAYPHHRLGAAPLDQPAAALVVRPAHRVGDLCDAEAEGRQPVRVDRDLDLPAVAAERG